PRHDVERFLADARFPVVLKPIDPTRFERRTGRRLAIVATPEALLTSYLEWEDRATPNLMLQEHIPGGDDTVWMFNGVFNEWSECVAAFTGRKLRQHPVYGGTSSLGVCEGNERVERLTIDFMWALGYQGVLDVGYRYDARDAQYKLLDPNPRVGSTFRLFVDEQGLDVVRVLYCDITRQPVWPRRVREGRKWLVEDHDLDSSLARVRDGTLTPRLARRRAQLAQRVVAGPQSHRHPSRSTAVAARVRSALQALRQAARPDAVRPGRNHGELREPHAPHRIRVARRGAHQPGDVAQHAHAGLPSHLGRDDHARHGGVVVRRLEDQLPGAPRQPAPRIQPCQLVHQAALGRPLALEPGDQIDLELGEQRTRVHRHAQQLPHAGAQRAEMVLPLGTVVHQQQDRRARADQRIGA